MGGPWTYFPWNTRFKVIKYHQPHCIRANLALKCCNLILSFQFLRSDLSPEESLLCFPIRVPRNDPFYRGRKDCIPLVRSVAGINLDCRPGPLQQLNQITHWIDSSNVYGSSIEETNDLRRFRDGLLRYNLFAIAAKTVLGCFWMGQGSQQAQRQWQGWP